MDLRLSPRHVAATVRFGGNMLLQLALDIIAALMRHAPAQRAALRMCNEERPHYVKWLLNGRTQGC